VKKASIPGAACRKAVRLPDEHYLILLDNITFWGASMAAMSISMSDAMRDFVRSRVESGDYHNESEYIRDLVRRDQERLSEDERLLKRLRAARASGLSERSVLDIMREAEGDMREKAELAANKGGRQRAR
jgi:antitoxin ParD1/3/4